MGNLMGTNKITAVENDWGNYDITIPNLGLDDLKVQVAILNKVAYPDNDELYAIIDVLQDVIYAMEGRI
jgi:hypothetical protein